MFTLIKNGRVIDPLNNVDEILDILIKDDKIVKISKNIDTNVDDIIDATDKWVVPALIDLHVHLRDPGLTYKEDIKTGSMSAKKGGFTTICAMPNTIPVTDSVEVLQYVLKTGAETGIDVLPISAITISQKGEKLVDFHENSKYAIAFSEDGLTVHNPKTMYEALKLAEEVQKPIFAHCEDHFLKNGGQIHEGKISEKFGLKGITPLCEDVIVARDILLANENKAKLHICHVSTEGTIKLIKNGKKYNQNLTSEICPHHFVLSDEDITTLDSNYKMAPPLRSKSDVLVMKEALKNDVIDVIATDHAPHSLDEKSKDFNLAPNGIIGLETLVPLTITYLVKENYISPSQFVQKTSLNPAKIIGIDKGHLSIGAVCDITIIDVDNEYTIDVNKMVSKSKNTPFNGFKVNGEVHYTICKGKVVYKKENL